LKIILLDHQNNYRTLIWPSCWNVKIFCNILFVILERPT